MLEISESNWVLQSISRTGRDLVMQALCDDLDYE